MAELIRPVPSQGIIEGYCGLGNMKVPLENVLAYARSIYQGLSELPSLQQVYPLLDFSQLLITAHKLNKSRRGAQQTQQRTNFSLMHSKDEVVAYLRNLIEGYRGGLLSNSNYALREKHEEHKQLNPHPLDDLEGRLKQLRPETTTQLLGELMTPPRGYYDTADGYNAEKVRLVDDEGLTDSQARERLVYLDFLGALSPSASFATKTKTFAKAIHEIMKDYPKVNLAVSEEHHCKRPERPRADIYD